LSPYCRALIGDGAGKHVEVQKLIPNLRSKWNYYTDYKNLKISLSLEMKLTKVIAWRNFRKRNGWNHILGLI
jgi:hypothetical protein